MNLEFYKNFLVVAETGNITIAARRLNLAQPALSGQLKALETHYGTRLIDAGRGRRQLRLTAAGVDFLRRAQEICRAEEGLALDLSAYQEQSGGTLRLATSPVVMDSFMDKYLLPFARRYPKITLQLKEEVVEAQLEDIKKGRIDIAYANAPLPESDSFSCRRLATEHFSVVWNDTALPAFRRADDKPGSQGLPGSASEAPLCLNALQGLPLTCNRGCAALLTDLCHSYGFTPNIRLIADTGNAVVRFAASGAAIAVVSDSCCQNLPPGLSRLPLNEPSLSYSQTLLWAKEQNPPQAVKKFLEMFG